MENIAKLHHNRLASFINLFTNKNFLTFPKTGLIINFNENKKCDYLDIT